MNDIRTFTPAEIIRLIGKTKNELAKELGISSMTLLRKEKSNKWTAAEIRILSELSNIPISRIVF
ncbi:hypothetical protein [Pseudobutyrivibrio sp.]